MFHLTVKAKELASKVGGEAITLADLENFHPEDGMILANTTSVGMKPNINDTPLSKVCPPFFSHLTCDVKWMQGPRGHFHSLMFGLKHWIAPILVYAYMIHRFLNKVEVVKRLLIERNYN